MIEHLRGRWWRIPGVAIVSSDLMKLKRYPDRCYAVIRGNRRGPCGHDKPTAIARFLKSGLIAGAGTDKR